MHDAVHWLKYVTAEGIVLAQTRISGDWGVRVDQQDVTFFHFVVEGQAYVTSENIAPVHLLKGDIILLNRGSAHQISHALDSKVIPLGEFLQKNNGVISADPDASNVVCGSFSMDRQMLWPALRSLPAVLHLRASELSESSQVSITLRRVCHEVEQWGMGSQAMVQHLLSTLFIYILREWADAAPAQIGTGFFAIQSSHVAKALACIHERAAEPWTLASLAGEAGMSRAAFAKQFRSAVGEPPLSYLSRWRMGIAAQLLERTELNIAEVCIQVGYASEYSFSRAFKQARGISPIQHRMQNHSEPIS